MVDNLAMRIGLVLDVFQSYTSGVVNFVNLLQSHLLKAGCEPYIFAFGQTLSADPERRVYLSPGLVLPNGYAGGLRFAPSIQQIMRQMDVLHLQHPFVSGPLAYRVVKDRQIPLVFTNHTRYDLYLQSYLPLISANFSRRLLGAYLPAFCNHLDLVISPSLGVEKVMRSWGVDCPVEIVPNGINLLPFQRPSQPISRNEMGFSEDDVIWAYAGRISPEKNLAALARTFIQVFEQAPAAKLLLIGDGPDREVLSTMFSSAGKSRQVHFAGLVPYEQIPNYLAAADAFVTASVTEVHPLTLIEAMAAGLPLVGIMSPGVSDLIQPGQNGILAQSAQADFISAIFELTNNTGLRQRLALGARRLSLQYSIESTTKCMIDLYTRLVQEKSTSAL